MLSLGVGDGEEGNETIFENRIKARTTIDAGSRKLPFKIPGNGRRGKHSASTTERLTLPYIKGKERTRGSISRNPVTRIREHYRASHT